jgi:hypothetical protein
MVAGHPSWAGNRKRSDLDAGCVCSAVVGSWKWQLFSINDNDKYVTYNKLIFDI